MEKDTVTQREFSVKKGERYLVKKAKDSDVFRGDGSFTSETSKNTDYTNKKGERYDAVRPNESDIWKATHVPAIGSNSH